MRKLGMIQKNKSEDVGGGIWVLFPLSYFISFFYVRFEESRSGTASLNYIRLGRRFVSSLLTLTLPTSVMCNTVTAGKQTVLFFIFITALKSIGDSRLDEHEAFLQLPCRCRLANIHWTLMNRIKGPQLFSLYETNVREAYEFISAFTQTVASFTRRVRFLTAS